MKDHNSPTSLEPLRQFRQLIYDHVLTGRRDSQFEVLDALLMHGPVSSYVELSQTPEMLRGWSSLYTAMDDGTQDSAWLFDYAARHAPHEGLCVWALDCSAWPHPDAETMEGLGYVHQATHAVNGGDVTIGYNYSWLSYVPEARRSWTLPAQVGRVPSDQDALTYGAHQVQQLCHVRQNYSNKVDIIAGDGNYGTCRFLSQVWDQPCGVVARLRRDRALRRRPDPARPRQKIHGPRFEFKCPDTWPTPDEDVTLTDARYGQVRLRRWNALHDVCDAATEFDVLRVDTHLERSLPPDPDWLMWHAPPTVPPGYCLDAPTIWRAFDQRWPIEPSLRFCKQALMWTTPHFAIPQADDRWTIIVFLALWLLALARPVIADCPRPWHQRLTPGGALRPLTPRRVQLGFAALVVAIGSPVRVPQTRGFAPGWPRGKRRTPRPCFPVVKKAPRTYARNNQRC